MILNMGSRVHSRHRSDWYRFRLRGAARAFEMGILTATWPTQNLALSRKRCISCERMPIGREPQRPGPDGCNRVTVSCEHDDPPLFRQLT